MAGNDGKGEEKEWSDVRNKAGEILSIRDEVTRQRSRPAQWVDAIGRVLARPLFLIAIVAFHVAWIVLNLPLMPWRPWDPYPFTFLATLASIEGPFFSLLVLMAQQRQSRVNELREEVSLQVSLHAERKTTMALRLLQEVEGGLNIKSDQKPEVLKDFSKPLDPEHLTVDLRNELRRDESTDEATPA